MSLQLQDDESIKGVLNAVVEEELAQQMEVGRLVLGGHLTDVLHLALHDGTCNMALQWFSASDCACVQGDDDVCVCVQVYM